MKNGSCPSGVTRRSVVPFRMNAPRKVVGENRPSRQPCHHRLPPLDDASCNSGEANGEASAVG
jgi:hypothetical protein